MKKLLLVVLLIVVLAGVGYCAAGVDWDTALDIELYPQGPVPRYQY